jgi:hypothetical protein
MPEELGGSYRGAVSTKQMRQPESWLPRDGHICTHGNCEYVIYTAKGVKGTVSQVEEYFTLSDSSVVSGFFKSGGVRQKDIQRDNS